MRHTVIKLGGSVLTGADDALPILDILDSYSCPLVVVVSGLKGVTDALQAAYEEPRRFETLVPTLRDRYRSLARAFEAPLAAQEAALIQIERLLGGLGLLAQDPCGRAEGRLRLLRATDEEPRGANADDRRARILAMGERLSAVCVSLAFAALGRPAPVIEPGRLGLLALPSDREGEAEADIAGSAPRIRAALQDRDAAVVPGFYGLGADGLHYLFGRGGSDYSAAVIAACIGAERCDLIKGVAGFFTADPSLVPDARLVQDLSYAEAEALAQGGAKILHKLCVEPLRASGVPLRILGGPGLPGSTRVGSPLSRRAEGPRALALKLAPSGCASITVAGGTGASASALRVLRALDASGLRARAFVPGADGSSFQFIVEAGKGGEALRVAHDALFV